MADHSEEQTDYLSRQLQMFRTGATRHQVIEGGANGTSKSWEWRTRGPIHFCLESLPEVMEMYGVRTSWEFSLGFEATHEELQRLWKLQETLFDNFGFAAITESRDRALSLTKRYSSGSLLVREDHSVRIRRMLEVCVGLAFVESIMQMGDIVRWDDPERPERPPIPEAMDAWVKRIFDVIDDESVLSGLREGGGHKMHLYEAAANTMKSKAQNPGDAAYKCFKRGAEEFKKFFGVDVPSDLNGWVELRHKQIALYPKPQTK